MLPPTGDNPVTSWVSGVGCFSTVKARYDCDEGFQSWQTGWTLKKQARRAWCDHRNLTRLLSSCRWRCFQRWLQLQLLDFYLNCCCCLLLPLLCLTRDCQCSRHTCSFSKAQARKDEGPLLMHVM